LFIVSIKVLAIVSMVCENDPSKANPAVWLES
jgi:hypothetical protein